MSDNIKESIGELVDQIMTNDPAAYETFNSIMTSKVQSYLENMRVDIAQQFFNKQDNSKDK